MDTTLIESIARAAERAHRADDLASDLLPVLCRVADLDCGYLTVVDRGRGEQEVLVRQGPGPPAVSAGDRLAWTEPLVDAVVVRDAASGSSDGLPSPDLAGAVPPAARAFLSVPVAHVDGEVVGELCGVAGEPRPLPASAVLVAKLLARLIADQVARDRRVAAALPSPVDAASLREAQQRARAAERRATTAEGRAGAAERRAEIAEEEARSLREGLHDTILRSRQLLADAEARTRALRERLIPMHVRLERQSSPHRTAPGSAGLPTATPTARAPGDRSMAEG